MGKTKAQKDAEKAAKATAAQTPTAPSDAIPAQAPVPATDTAKPDFSSVGAPEAPVSAAPAPEPIIAAPEPEPIDPASKPSLDEVPTSPPIMPYVGRDSAKPTSSAG